MNLRQFFIRRAIGFVVIMVVIGIVAAFYSFNNYIYEQKQAYAAADYKDAEYVISGTPVRLTDGVAETEAAPGSATKIVTRYFGNEVTADVNGDGREDKVFLLTQDMSGSGLFYYVVAALNTDRGYVGSEGLLLGDRIAPQTTEKKDKGVVVVNYADRLPSEPMTKQPSVGKSKWLMFNTQTMQFEEVSAQ
jgi:hypothetical protein